MKRILLFFALLFFGPVVVLVGLGTFFYGAHCWHEIGRSYAADVPGFCTAVALMGMGAAMCLAVFLCAVLVIAWGSIWDFLQRLRVKFGYTEQAASADEFDQFERLATEMPAQAPDILKIATARLQARLANAGKGGAS